MKNEVKNEAGMGLHWSSKGAVFTPSVPRVYKAKRWTREGRREKRRNGVAAGVRK